MKYQNAQMNISFQVNNLLKKHGIEAKLTELTILSKIIKNSIEFNQKLYESGIDYEVSLAVTVEELIEIYMLRSQVYKEMNYDSEFPEIIKGLNFDEYDECSAIIYSKREAITGTCRLIFDSSNKKLPIDKKFSLDYLRNQNKNLCEASRVIIKDSEGLKPEFKLLTIDSFKILTFFKMNAISVMTEEHLKLYKNFGGLSVEKKFQGYGSIDKLFLITLWNTSNISPFFKRIFLRNVSVS